VYRYRIAIPATSIFFSAPCGPSKLFCRCLECCFRATRFCRAHESSANFIRNIIFHSSRVRACNLYFRYFRLEERLRNHGDRYGKSDRETFIINSFTVDPLSVRFASAIALCLSPSLSFFFFSMHVERKERKERREKKFNFEKFLLPPPFIASRSRGIVSDAIGTSVARISSSFLNIKSQSHGNNVILA